MASGSAARCSATCCR